MDDWSLSPDDREIFLHLIRNENAYGTQSILTLHWRHIFYWKSTTVSPIKWWDVFVMSRFIWDLQSDGSIGRWHEDSSSRSPCPTCGEVSRGFLDLLLKESSTYSKIYVINDSIEIYVKLLCFIDFVSYVSFGRNDHHTIVFDYTFLTKTMTKFNFLFCLYRDNDRSSDIERNQK